MMINELSSIISLISIFLFWMILIVHLTVYYRFLKRLELVHPSEWRQLGKPSLIYGNSIRNNLTVLKYLRSKDYELLNDSQLSKFANLSKFSALIGIFLFPIYLCLILAIIMGFI